jgi:NTP pyrophosphatase (non-canonical NTP hydrolase)
MRNLLRAVKNDPLPTNIILNPDEASIEEYAEVIGNIWPQDKERPIWLIWIHVMSHATVVCEEVRKNRWHKVAKELAEVLVWWLTFIRRVTQPPPKNVSDAVKIIPYIAVNPSDIVWFKYPRLCPVCFGRWVHSHCQPTEDIPRLISGKLREIKHFFKENPQCTCLAAKHDVEERDGQFKTFTKLCLKEYAKKTRKLRRPNSLKEMAEMLNDIFANNIEVLSVEEIAFHLLEEVGEVSKSLSALFMQEIPEADFDAFLKERETKAADFAEEIADVFSWAVSLLAKIYRFLECAAQFAAEYKTVEGMPELVRGNLERTRNIVALIWTIYGKGSMLVCEQCKEFPCNPDHPAHEGKRGQLAGKHLPPALVEAIRSGKGL